uniref:hypothetical protein n=1 Tax=Gemmiger formicilis TaxID=745368 RepID=UPI004024A8EB
MPKCTVIFFGTTMRFSTLPGSSSSGAGPLPPFPAKRVCGGIVTMSVSTSPVRLTAEAGAAPAGSRFSRATVCWASKTCTPFSTRGCQPSGAASMR